MRVLNYPLEANICYKFNKYDNKMAQISLQEGLNTLPFTQRGEYYKDSFCNVFYIYEGEGSLEFEHALFALDFSEFDCIIVENALLQIPQELTKKEQRLLELFLKVYDLNIAKQAEYLLPYGFLQIEKEMLDGKRKY